MCYLCICHYFTTAQTIGVPSVTIAPLTRMSFYVDWTISDSNYTHTFDITWRTINMCNAQMSETVSGNNYTVTNLSAMCDYNVSVAATCGMNNDTVTVYGKN